MLILTAETDKIQAVLAGAVTANQLQCMASWRDITTTTYAPGRTLVNTNNTTDVDLVGSPGASTQRVVDFISIYQWDTVNATVTVKFDANGTEYILFKATLAPGESLIYQEGIGFRVFSNAGSEKLSINQGTNATSGLIQTVVLGSDVINNNAVANTIASVTGLSFEITTAKVYWFRFYIWYTANATTTGSRWSITGPAITSLTYMSEYSLTATTTTRNANLTGAYDLPAASNVTSGATGANFALVEGYLVASADGTLIARFASEVAGAAITAKAGSFVHYQQLT